MDVAVRETDTPTVLVAAHDPGWAVAALAAIADVETADAVSAARAAVADGTVDCVVTESSLADGTALDLVAAVREVDADCPVVYAPPAPAPEIARLVTAHDATSYLPRDDVGGEALRDRVERLVDAHDDRRQLRREREMFQTLLNNVPLSIYFKNREGEHVCVSTEVSAARTEQIVGKTDYEVYAEDIGEAAAQAAYEDDLRVMDSGEPVIDKEERHVTASGNLLWLRTTKIPWRNDDGEVVGLVGVTQEITAAKERERALEQEKRRLEQFASFASHDLRNPVNVAKGYVERAIETGDEAHLAEVVDALDRMDHLIDDLLDMARPEQDGQIEEWTDLGEVARRAWAAVDAEEASLTLSLPEDAEIRASSGGLRQLLENLFSNSIEHGGEAVAVEVGFTETGFYVADDGPGIPAEHREEVFDYGYTTGGTGVGLAITKDIADAHDWATAVAESASGGARFEFDAVMRRPPAAETIQVGSAAPLTERANVGDAEPVGEALEGGDGDWTIQGGGKNFWGDLDEYFAAFTRLEGDLRVEGRLRSLDRIHDATKAGVVLLDEAEPGSPLGFAGMTVGRGAETLWRPERGEPIESREHRHVDQLPRWFRIDRLGDRVTCYVSADGEDWTALDQHVLACSGSVAAGIAVCSHNDRRLCEATFEDVRVVELRSAPAAEE